MTHTRMVGLELSESDAPLLAQLPTPYQEMLRMAAAHNSSCASIARTMGLNIGTVKSRLHRAKTALIALRPKLVQPA